MGHLAIFALGPLRIELDGLPLQTSRHKALALLVYLTMHPGKQSREKLSALLWPEYEQEKAYAYLRRTLWEIHTLLGEEWIEADREEIGFCQNASIYLDVEEFHSHLTTFDRHNHPTSPACQECMANLHTAALLYRGDFLAGFGLRDSANFEDWQFFQNEGLRRDYAGVLRKLVFLLNMKSAFDEAAVFARRWLALDTLNEEAHRELMRTYALSGQRNQALRQYQECRRLLQTELSVTPEQATISLYEAIQSGIIPHLVPETDSNCNQIGEPFSAKEVTLAGTMQTPTGPIVGREQELQQITALLADPDCWLLTLLGPGGIGKTRLAVKAGSKQQEHFSQGVFFVPLNSVETEPLLIPAIARSTGLIFRQDGSSPEEQLLDFLREKQLLLILDSFESLVQSAGLLGKIHFHAKEVKILVTSRHRLPLQCAWVMEIRGLDYPQGAVENWGEIQRYSAVQLFLLAAHRVEFGFRVSEMDFPSIVRITQLLEGMPLGLELAATWIKTLSCQEIANEISHSLDFLGTSLQDLPERQRSIRAVFDYSWNLLSNREQRLFARLAVFQGRFTRQAAEQIAGISLRELAGLVDKSLVQRTTDGRFGLHDLLRQYCMERLDSTPADRLETKDRHAAFFCAELSEWNAGLGRNKPGQILSEIEADLENARAAWGWAVIRECIAWLDQAADGLCMFFLRRARFVEGLTTCQQAESALSEVLAVETRRFHARILTWQAVYSINLGNFQDAEPFLDESRRLIDDLETGAQQVAKERYFLLTIQAEEALLQYNLSSFLGYFEKSIALALTTGITVRWAVFYWRYLMSAGTSSDKEYHLLKEVLPYLRKCGDPFELGCTLYTLGILAGFWYYRLNEAEPMLKESCDVFQTLDDPISQVMILKTRGFLVFFQGNFTDHLELKKRELSIYQVLGDRRMTGLSHSEVGECLYHLRRYEEAEAQIRMGMDLLKNRVEHEYALRHRYLGDALLAQGKQSDALDAYRYSFRFFNSVGEKTWMLTALTGISRAELAMGDRSGAWEHAVQALRLYYEGGVFTFFVYQTLAVFALLLADKGELYRALELYGLAFRQPTLANSLWFADLYGRLIDEATSMLPGDKRAEANRCGQELELSEAVENLLARFVNLDR